MRSPSGLALAIHPYSHPAIQSSRPGSKRRGPDTEPSDAARVFNWGRAMRSVLAVFGLPATTRRSVDAP